MDKSMGGWAFIIGLVLAIIVAVVVAVSGAAIPTWSVIVLAVLGLIVGFLNVGGREVMPFLVASIAFLVTFQSLATIVGKLPIGGELLSVFFGLVTVFIGPAAAVVALKELFAATKD